VLGGYGSVKSGIGISQNLAYKKRNIKKRTNYWRNYKKPEGELIVMNN